MSSPAAPTRLVVAGQASSTPEQEAAAAKPSSYGGAAAAGSSLGPGDERFNQVYDKALLRKRLFKDYLSRHQVLEKFNRAIEALYEQEQLPEDPLPFMIEQLKAPPRQGAGRPSSYRPASALPKRSY